MIQNPIILPGLMHFAFPCLAELQVGFDAFADKPARFVGVFGRKKLLPIGIGSAFLPRKLNRVTRDALILPFSGILLRDKQ